MTAQTVSYLKTNLLATGQAAGAITPTRMQDIPDSFPPWDNPGSVATPYLMRGTWDGQAYFLANGGALGTVGATQRTTNLTVLNTLFSTATSNGNFVELESGTYQISGSGGLLMPANGSNPGFVFRGNPAGTIIQQFYATSPGAPVLTIGDTTGATSTTFADIDGLQLGYGASQTGFTSSAALVIGYTQSCQVKNLFLYGLQSPFFLPYDAVQISANHFGTFSNNFINWGIYGWQRHGINYTTLSDGSTGNSWDNIYMNNSVGTAQTTMSGNYICFQAGTDDQHFKRLNCEWGGMGGSNPAIIYTNASQTGLRFDALHIEGVQWNGNNPAVFNTYGDTIQVDVLDIVSPKILSASITTAPAAIVYDWVGQASSIKIASLNLKQNQASYQDTTLQFISLNGGPLGDDVPTISIDHGGLITGATGNLTEFVGHLTFDGHLALNAAAVTVNRWGRYDFGPVGSKIRNAVITVTATYTHYGQMEDCTILVPASITSFTLTLAATMGATGTQLPRFGNTLHIRRLSGTASGTLTVTNAGQAGGNLTAPNTGGTDQWYEWRPYLATAANNITQGNWVTITHVT